MTVHAYRDVRLGPGVMLRVERTLGGWVWHAPGSATGAAWRYYMIRTTTASGWRVRAHGGRLEREVTSLKQCADTAYRHWQAQQALDTAAIASVS